MATVPITLPSIYKNIQAPAGSNPQDVQSTQDQMAMQYAPQENGISNTINTINQFLDRDVNAQQQYGQNADQKITEIGNNLAQQLQGNVGAIGNIYQSGQQAVGGAYDEAANTAKGVGQSVIDRVTSSANALGQGQALKADPYGADPISRLMATQATAQSRIATGKAGSVANLATLGTSLQGIAQKAVGDSEREYAQKRTDVATQVLKVIGQLQNTANQSIQEQLNKFSDLAATEGPAFRTLLNQATQSRNATARQNALDAFNQAIALGKLQQGQQKLDQANDPNSLDNIIKGQTITKNQQGLEAGTYLGSAEGMQNLQTFLDSTRRPARGQAGLSGTQVAGIQNFINQNLPATQMSGLYNTVDPAAILMSLAQQNLDQKTGMAKLPVTAGSKYDQSGYEIDLPTLAAALEARFKNVGTAKQIGAKVK